MIRGYSTLPVMRCLFRYSDLQCSGRVGASAKGHRGKPFRRRWNLLGIPHALLIGEVAFQKFLNWRTNLIEVDQKSIVSVR